MGKPVRINGPVKSLLNSLGIRERVKEAGAVEAWSEAVGKEIAEKSEAISCVEGRLTVRVSDSTWSQELHFMRQELIDAVNESLGEKIVREIVFR